MIASMTGYGTATLENENYIVSVEIKSINNKTQDLFLKIPRNFAEEELKIRSLLVHHLVRGKFSATIKVFPKKNPEHPLILINKNLLKSLYNEIQSIQNDLNITSEIPITALFHLPDVLLEPELSVNEEEWQITEKALLQAIENLKASRLKEGKALQQDILKQIELIESLVPEIEKYEKERIENIKLKLQNAYKEHQNDLSIPPERFEQELFFYLEKLDINEEKVRLLSHIQYFKEVVDKEEIVGKKLQFIAQEMGREINTIGSKANEYHIQKIIVQMKDALEKIKEQLNNVL